MATRQQKITLLLVLTRIAAKANWRRDHSRVAVTPHGDEPESSVGKFSGGNFKVGTLEDLLRRCNPDKKYIGNSTKGNEILPSCELFTNSMGELGIGDTRHSGNAEK
jgi:hypothetical protein